MERRRFGSFVLILLLSSFFSLVRTTDLPAIVGQETVIEGNSVVLKCNSTATSVKSFSWTRNGSVLSSGENVGFEADRLIINSAYHENDSGSYNCIVKLEDESEYTSAPFSLTVQYFSGYLSVCHVDYTHGSLPPRKPAYEFEDDQGIQFECCFEDAEFEPRPNVSWWKIRNEFNDISPQFFANGSTLIISSLQFYDTGVYECRSEHVAGDESHRIFLYVTHHASTKVEEVKISTDIESVCAELDSVAVLPCEVSGPVVQISWRLGGVDLDYQDRRYSFQSDKLVIHGVVENDVEQYTCLVTGKKDDVKRHKVSLVSKCITKVNITEYPDRLISNNEISVGVGNSLKLVCTASVLDFLPVVPMYTWTFPNGSSSLGNVLYLANVRYSDKGNFTCTADNEYSNSVSDQVRLRVRGPLMIKGMPNLIGKLNHTLNISCWSNMSSTTFVWKNGTEIIDSTNRKVVITNSMNGSSSVLSIKALTSYDATTYTCEIDTSIHVPVTQNFFVSLSDEIYLSWDFGNPAGLSGSTFSVVCPVVGGKGQLHTTWLRNNSRITTSDIITDGKELTILSLNLLHEYDNFTCLVNDGENQTFRKDFRVIVEIPAVFKNSENTDIDATVGEEVNFECQVMGKPMPDIIWIPFDGQKIQGRYKNFTNGSFRIQNVTMGDEGKYLCYFRWKDMKTPQSKITTLRVVARQSTNSENDDTQATILGLEQNIFIAIVVAAVGVIFLVLALVLCFCLICRYCCCQKQQTSEIPIGLETTTFERKPSIRGSYRFKDNSGILGKAANPSNTFTFQSDRTTTNSIPMTTASSVAVSPGPPIPSPVPTPAGPTTSMVTSPEFQLPNNVTSFPRQNLKLDNVMGEGEFGPVFKGVARNIIKDQAQSLVAVKVLISREGEESLWPSLMEFANQMKLSSPFIASIVGICSDSEPYYVIYDYLDRGDLKRFLLNSRPAPNSIQPPSLTQSELLHIVTQVSKGMSYLYKQQIIHGDLATRNCLISSDLTVKIADLGIGHDLYPDDYHDNGTQLLPIRWMAPELFIDSSEGPAFSLASDVWSFGVFCWEVFAYARQPYDELSDAQVLRLIPAGHVLGAPEEGCPPLLFSLMQDCWAASVEQRPIFTTITSDILSIDVD